MGGDRFLVLERGQRNDFDMTSHFGETLAGFETYRVLVDRTRRCAEVKTRSHRPEPSRTVELIRTPTAAQPGRAGLALRPAAGRGQPAAAGRWAWRRPIRGDPSNWNLLFALLAFIVYFNLVNLTRPGWQRALQPHGHRRC